MRTLESGEALMLKKVAADSDATAASIVFPFAGGPYRSKPAFSSPKVDQTIRSSKNRSFQENAHKTENIPSQT
jgi:hypothetical protein